MKADRPKHRPSMVGMVLKEHRKQQGITQEQAAHYLGIEPRTLRMYENGERSIENVRELRRIATLLGIDPQRFGLASLTVETCTPEQVEEVVKNAWAFLAQTRFTEARTIVETMLRDLRYYASQDTALLHAMAQAHHVAGHVVALMSRTNELGQAMRHFQEMEDIARTIKDDTLLNVALTYHGDMFRKRGELAKAKIYLETARDMTPGADEGTRGNSAQLLGRVYLYANDVNGFERSLAISEELGYSLNLTGDKVCGAYNLGTVYEEYARGYNTLGQPQKSMIYLDKARKTLPSSQRWDMVLRATEAETLVRSGEMHEGIQRAISVALFARIHGYNRLLERVYRLHNYLDRKMLEINQATMSLREALIGSGEIRAIPSL